MSIPILSQFYESYLYYSDIVCISFISIYESAYIILISSANSQFRLYSDFKIYIQSCLYYSDISTYRLYLFKNRHSDSFGKKNIRFLSIRAIKSPQNRQKMDI